MMKHTIYAVLAAALSMLATSGALVLATAAPTTAPVTAAQSIAEAELTAHLDALVASQLEVVKARLGVAHTAPNP